MVIDFTEEERQHLENYLNLSQDLNKVKKHFRRRDFDEAERLLQKSAKHVQNEGG